MSATELTTCFIEGRLSPVEVAKVMLERIAELDPHLNTYITVTDDAALEAARSSERRYRSGAPLGPLDGVPMGVKDVIDTAGIRTTANSRRYETRVPKSDATVVRRAREAGAVLLGKHTTYEFAALPPDPAATDALAPPTRNPWDPSVTTGGSSSGSAGALAAGLCTVAIGTDTGGSIRNPSSFCSTTGLKPSRGRVSRHGVIALSRSSDSVGPMACNVGDAAHLLAVIAGPDPCDPATLVDLPAVEIDQREPSVQGLRIGTPRRIVSTAPGVDPETVIAYESALATFEALGANVRTVDLPDYEHVNAAGQTILLSEAFAEYEGAARERRDLFGSRFFDLLLQGAMFTAADLVVAQRARDLIAAEADDLMDEVDLIILPTTPHPARTFEFEAALESWRRSPFTRYFNLTGQPAISVPCGYSPQGLPIGLQIAARCGNDARVLLAAGAYQSATDWHMRRASPH